MPGEAVLWSASLTGGVSRPPRRLYYFAIQRSCLIECSIGLPFSGSVLLVVCSVGLPWSGVLRRVGAVRRKRAFYSCVGVRGRFRLIRGFAILELGGVGCLFVFCHYTRAGAPCSRLATGKTP